MPCSKPDRVADAFDWAADHVADYFTAIVLVMAACVLAAACHFSYRAGYDDGYRAGLFDELLSVTKPSGEAKAQVHAECGHGS
jgi:hypothetical protein